MTKELKPSTTKLRRDAEARMQKQSADTAPLSEHEVRKLLHELQVHQIELEMQNEELQQSQIIADDAVARYIDLYDFSPTGLISLMPDGTISQLNLTAARLLGRDRNQLEGARFDFFVAESNRLAFNDFLQQVFNSEGMEVCELPLMTENKTWVEKTEETQPASCTVLVEATRSVDGQECQMVLVDVSELRHTGVLLEKQLVLTKTITDNACSCLFMMDESGHPTFMNPAAVKETGYTLEEIKDRPLHDAIHNKYPDGRPYPMSECPIDNAQAASVKMEDYKDIFVRKNGDMFPVICQIAPLMSKDKVVGSVLEFRDFSTQQQLQEQLIHSQRMESVGELAGGIAHDFNNLLNIIQSNFEFLQDYNLKDDDYQKWIETGLRAVSRGASLTRRLLSFSKKEAIDQTTINANALILKLKELIRSSLTPKITVELNLCEDECDITINTDEFQDVLINLILNARDAMPSGGLLQIATSKLQLTKQDIEMHPGVDSGNYLMVSISDNGCGMDKEMQQKIFDPFYTTKGKDKGSGLGLSMVDGFIKRNNGFIKINSEIDHGTTMQLYLPSTDETKVDRDESNTIKPVMPHGTELILAVDDEEDNLQSMKYQLESLGYQVLLAKNAYEALEVINSHNDSIDLLFSDVVMPGMSGYELVNEVRNRKLDIKILLASGFTGKITKKERLLLGDLKMIQKPFSKLTLAQNLRKLLDSDNSKIKE